MDKKQYLCRYHNLQNKINYLKKDIERCKELALSIPGPKYDAIRVDYTRDLLAPFEKWVIRQIEDETELANLEKDAEAVKDEILMAISLIGDTEKESVLIHRYVYWESWNEISNKIFASPTSVRRIHTKALELFKVPK